jgi:hypothetical protein
MNSKSFCSPVEQPRGIEAHMIVRTARAKSSVIGAFVLVTAFLALTAVIPAVASDAPSWMHALTSVPLPAHDEKTDAILLYSEDIVSVQSNGKIKNLHRVAYKILRPDGRKYGTVLAYFDSETRITGMRGWCIPAQGKDYEVKEKEATETAAFNIENGILATDLRVKYLHIPAPDPGNIVGYELEQEERPYVFESDWDVQGQIPVRQARYTLQLPAGWEYKAVWVNHTDVASTTVGNNQFQWVVDDLKAVKHEEDMPPWRALGARMVVTILPTGGAAHSKGFQNWSDVGVWYINLLRGRRDTSPAISQKVIELTSTKATQLQKLAAIAGFVQNDIRYVAVELGIGGWQPHAANDVYTHRYGDCKDKATLMASMLQQLGVDSYHVAINTHRGAVGAATPAQFGSFNHAILAIKLPSNLSEPSLVATIAHPKLGTLLFFDPTDTSTPFGQLRGELQANFGLLVTADGGELTELPQLPSAMNSIHRMGKFTLAPNGILSGDVSEQRVGDRAAEQREMLKSVAKADDKIKSIETLLAHSLSSFQITKATVSNLDQTDKPFGFNYSLIAGAYAKPAGDLLLVRPRVIGVKGSGVLETKDPRQYPLEFAGPAKDTDTFDITIPPGYVVDDLPPALDLDYSFASYHSKTEAKGNILHYTRSFEIKELSVPVAKMDELKKFYRAIAGDERNTAVLKPSAK